MQQQHHLHLSNYHHAKVVRKCAIALSPVPFVCPSPIANTHHHSICRLNPTVNPPISNNSIDYTITTPATTKKGGRGKPKTKFVSRSSKAGLQFSVDRVARFLKEGRYAQRVGYGSPIYLSVVLEYLCVEVLGTCGNDEELSKLMGSVTIANGGVLPNIHQNLLPKKVVGKGKTKIGSVRQEF
ncbi:Histone H2AX [Lathyrus oleraceus]|uniref:Histone H2A n=1 Tax=Pisum sativum TaxID=3888 RepID=A0A9D4XNL7_PEA|nr:Histone H2AX [Pisum sativum]